MSGKESCETAAENAQMQSESNSGEGEQNKHLTLDDLSDEEILDDHKELRADSLARILAVILLLEDMSESFHGRPDSETAIYYGDRLKNEANSAADKYHLFILMDAYVRRRFPERSPESHD